MFPFFARLFAKENFQRQSSPWQATDTDIQGNAIEANSALCLKGAGVAERILGQQKEIFRVFLYKRTSKYCIYGKNTCNLFNILPISIVYPSKIYVYIYLYKQVVSIYCVYLCTCKTWSTGTNLTCWGIFLERFTSPKLPFGPILGSFLLGSLMRFLVERIVERFEVYLTSLNPPARFYQNGLRLTFQIDLPSFWHQKGWMNTVDGSEIRLTSWGW